MALTVVEEELGGGYRAVKVKGSKYQVLKVSKVKGSVCKAEALI